MTTAQIHILDSQTDKIISYLSNTGEQTLIYDDLHVRQLENNVETFDFTTVPEADAVAHLRKRNRVIIPADTGDYREFIIDEVIQDFNQVNVYCTASHLDLKRNRPFAPMEYNGETVNSMLDILLAGTDWQRGVVSFSTTVSFSATDYITPFDALMAMAKSAGIELLFRVETNGNTITGRYVDAVERVGSFQGREIVSGKDLVNATRRENTEKVVTALIGVGPERNGNKIIVEVTNEEARQAWGRKGQHLWGVYKSNNNNDNITQADIEQETQEALNQMIASVIEYTVDAVDLEQILGYSHERIRLGDTLRIKATEFQPPLYLDARVISISTPITDPSAKEFVLGEFIEYDEADILKLREIFREEFLNADFDLIYYGNTPPLDKSKLWVDTSSEPNIIYRWDEAQGKWVRTSYLDVEDIGAETPEGAQEKVDEGVEEAHRYTDFQLFKQLLLNITREHAVLEVRYEAIIEDPNLTSQEIITAITSAYSDYDAAYLDLVQKLEDAISDGKITEADFTIVNAALDEYRVALATLEMELQRGQVAITEGITEEIVEEGKVYSEAERYAGHAELMKREKDRYDAIYYRLLAEPKLEGKTVLSTLTTKWNTYNSRFTALETALLNAANDDVITETERQAIETATTAYRLAMSELESAIYDAEQSLKEIDIGDSAAEQEVALTDFVEMYSQKKISQGTIAPSNPLPGDLWIDTTKKPHVWKRWSGTAWDKATVDNFNELMGKLTNTMIEDKAIRSQHLNELSVTLGKLAENSVDGSKIVAYSIQAGNIASDAIYARHLSANSVTADAIAANTITANEIASGTITTDLISSAGINAGVIKSGTLTSVTINVDTDLKVGNNIQVGENFDTSWKEITLNYWNKLLANDEFFRMEGANIAIESDNRTTINGPQIVIGNNANSVDPAEKVFAYGTWDFSGATVSGLNTTARFA